jgi:hypothetical protein
LRLGRTALQSFTLQHLSSLRIKLQRDHLWLGQTRLGHLALRGGTLVIFDKCDDHSSAARNTEHFGQEIGS